MLSTSERVPVGVVEPDRPSGTRRLRLGIILLGLFALMVFSMLVSLRYGSLPVSWHEAWSALTDYRGGDSQVAQSVIRELRLPRTLVAVGVGMSLAVAGGLMQGLTRNPLADPGLLGINAGAGLAIALALVAGVTSTGTYVWLAFAGAALAGALVYGLGSIGGGATPIQLALAGAVISSVFGACNSTLSVLHPDIVMIQDFWLAGNVGGRHMGDFTAVVPFMVIGLVVALGCGRALNGLGLGDDMARSMGQRVAMTRLVVSLSVVLLSGSAVAVGGGIAFVGLTVPHAARWIAGPDYRWILPISALLGPTVVLLADTAGRMLGRPGEIEVGVMVALVGAPFFVFLARHRALATV